MTEEQFQQELMNLMVQLKVVPEKEKDEVREAIKWMTENSELLIKR